MPIRWCCQWSSPTREKDPHKGDLYILTVRHVETPLVGVFAGFLHYFAMPIEPPWNVFGNLPEAASIQGQNLVSEEALMGVFAGFLHYFVMPIEPPYRSTATGLYQTGNVEILLVGVFLAGVWLVRVFLAGVSTFRHVVRYICIYFIE